MSKKITIPSREELVHIYEQTKSISKTSKHFNTSNPTVRKWLKYYDIKIYSHQEACLADIQSNKHKTRLKSETYSKLNDYNWLYEQRMLLKRSYDDISNELGCSVVPVTKACKLLNIPMIKLNESNSITTHYLKDKEWLINQHVKSKKKLDEIAKFLGTTKSTVSRWMQFHNIETNPANSYDKTFNKRSEEEKELENYIKSLNVETLCSNRTILNGKELDIVIPEYNLAIEYNGIYSHIYRPHESSESKRKDKDYHYNKTKLCAEKGYTLIHIYSDDWTLKKDICKSMLCSKLGKLERIYARKCNIKSINKIEKKHFLENNHIQGNDKSIIMYGLYYKDNLVSVMTFSKSRYNKKYVWELSRFCNILFSTVIGGFSKLLKHFRSNHKGSIVSYADMNHSIGNVYLKNGFNLVKQANTSYSYVNLSKSIRRMHRANFMKSKITTIKNDTRTEYEIMKDMGYDKIYECGLLTYELI